jgi:hypothetical protein
MKAAPQVPKEIQEKVEKMQEEFGKLQQEAQTLAQENQALKSDQSSEQQKIAMKADADRQAREDRRAAMVADHQLEREKFEFEKQLEVEKTEHEIAMQAKRDDADCQRADKKLAQDHERRMNGDAVEGDAAAAGSDVVPQVMKAMKVMVETFAEALQQQAKFNEQIVAALNKPKTVSLGNIKRGPDGLTGAEATVQ